MAGGEGFEPPLAESESAVLPLDDPPVWENMADDFFSYPIIRINAYLPGLVGPVSHCTRPQIKRACLVSKPFCLLAGGEGFEPPLAESESAVLPLDDPPSPIVLRKKRN